VPPNGEIKVSCPPHTSVKAVEQFVLDNLSWIEKARKKVTSSPLSESYLGGGNKLVLFGKAYEIMERENDRFSLTLDGEIACLSAPKSAIREQKVDFVKKYLLSIAKEFFPPLVAYYEKVIGVKCSKIGYRFMTSRWGSCNVKSKHINFSVLALAKSKEYLEYLVVHELMHLVYPNHGKEFKSAIRSIIPNADMVAKQR
jgi:predicted metal-dependent hydrolase